MADDRTEQPTPKRRREAREKGQVPRSPDLTQAVLLLASLATIAFTGTGMMATLADSVGRGLADAGRLAGTELRPEDTTRMVIDALRVLVLVAGPVAATALVTVVGSQVAQGGWVFATKALQLNWNALNPATGLKKLAPSRDGINAVKLVLVTAVIGVVVYGSLGEWLANSAGLAAQPPVESARTAWTWADGLMRRCGFALLAVAAGDYAFRRYRTTSSLKMTKQEVKDDLRSTEGNPEIKARVRRIQMSMRRRRMLSAVPRATVVITNPTEYAVAIEYKRGVMAAPRVLAKGRGVLAARIKEIARAHGIPCVENVPLARALYAAVEPGDTIPADLFAAVAEVLAYLIRLKQLVL